jgi:DNA-binding MarR family transcriptional regulator
VLRSPHPTDGRATLIELTPAGRSVVKRATAALNEEIFSQSGFGTDDVHTLIDVLGRFRSHSGDF